MRATQGASTLSACPPDMTSAFPSTQKRRQNFDFLVWNPIGRKPIAIFGEVKGSVRNPTAVVTEVEEKRKIVEANLGYIKQEYLKTNADIICEFVIGIPSLFSVEIRDAVEASNSNVVVWQADSSAMVLELVQPPRSLAKGAQMLHHDPNLNRVLSDPIDVTNVTYGFFPQSHPVTKLRVLATLLKREPHGPIVELRDIEQAVESQLFYLKKEHQERVTSEMVKESVRIGFALYHQERAVLRIQSRFRQYKSLKDDLVEKWVQARLNAEREEEIGSKIQALETEMLAEQAKQPSLTDFCEPSTPFLWAAERPFRTPVQVWA